MEDGLKREKSLKKVKEKKGKEKLRASKFGFWKVQIGVLDFKLLCCLVMFSQYIIYSFVCFIAVGLDPVK